MEFLALLNHMEFLNHHNEHWLAPKCNGFGPRGVASSATAAVLENL
jgi:hypothetical protein